MYKGLTPPGYRGKLPSPIAPTQEGTATTAATAATHKVTISAWLEVPMEVELTKAKIKKLVADYIDPDEKNDLETPLETFVECDLQESLVNDLMQSLPNNITVKTSTGSVTFNLVDGDIDCDVNGVEVS